MTYDATAKKLAIKAIGTVESNLNYRAVNSTDPITVGFMQWYGTRAASLLNKMRTENPSLWVGVEASLTSSLNTYPDTNSAYWTTRYLTALESQSIREVLNNNKAIQNTVATADIDAYVAVATNAGMDKDGNTDAMLFFFSMYHQSPRRALSVLASAGAQSNIDRLHAVCLNEPVLGNYKTRYDTALRIIKSHDTTGIDDIPDPNPLPEEPVTGDNGSGSGLTRTPGAVAYVQTVGDSAHIRLNGGRTLVAVPNGRGWFIPVQDEGVGATVPDIPVPTPENAGWINHDNLIHTEINDPGYVLRLSVTKAPALGEVGPTQVVVTFEGATSSNNSYVYVSVFYNPSNNRSAETASIGLNNTGSPGSATSVVYNAFGGASRQVVRIVARASSGVDPVIAPYDPHKVLIWHPYGSELRPPDYPPPAEAENDVVQWMIDHVDRYNYSQGAGRLSPDASGYTDCSGLVYTAYMRVAGINIGTYTGSQYLKGTLVTQGSGSINESLLRPGDLIFYNWKTGRPTVDHVEMYIGNGQVCGHPGPGKGPTIKPVSWGIATASNYYVRRHLV